MSLADLTQQLSAIRIVLVETSHPGNIGSVARAMKTMGLSQLFLVNPKPFPMVWQQLWLVVPPMCWHQRVS